MIRAVIFDLDDTLYPERQFVLSGFSAIDRYLVEKHSVSGFLEKATLSFNAGQRGCNINVALEQLGVEPDTKLLEKLVGVYRAHKPRLSIYSDAQWAIQRLGKQKQLGILTDGYLETQRNKLEGLGIVDWFDQILYTDERGRENWKPSPRPYLEIAGRFGCSGSECLYVGDNPSKDFIAPKTLGWLTVRVIRETGEHARTQVGRALEADTVLTSLEDLPSICI
jgi:putative hydrolase of the HAD superfamily